MALVAYGNSDSEFEDDEIEPNSSARLANKLEDKAEPYISSTQNGPSPQVESENLFNRLPRPSSKMTTVVEEEDDEFLHKKETAPNVVKPKARITVPSLSDFKDVDEKPNKPKAPSSKKSGLLSMLPQPKNAVKLTTTSKSLIPHVLTQKTKTPASKKNGPVPSSIKQTKVSAPLALEYSDDSDDENGDTDFFSINKPVELPPDNVPLDIDEVPRQHVNEIVPQDTKSIQSYFKQDRNDNSELQPDDNSYEESSILANESAQGSSSNELALDEEAIRQLCGSRGKRKREDIQIVDVDQKEVLAEARQLLMKGLMEDTSKRVSSSKKKGNEPTNQQRRKHQITYLAHQAKANEAELQNQWANNRMSKRQTQSKYGF